MIPDDFFAHPSPHYSRALRERVFAAWRNAQRFEFSTEASEVAGKLAFGAPDLVINHRQFAIAPYPTTYVEMDSRAFFDVGAAMGIPFATTSKGGRDLRVGYLIDGGTVYTFSTNPLSTHEFALTPFAYRTAPPGETVDFVSSGVYLRPHPGSRDDPLAHRNGMLALFLGSALQTTAAQLAGDDIYAANTIEALVPMSGADLAGWWGDLRNIWTVLLWLNQPARCRFTDVPPSRHIRRGKLRTYSAFRTVEIELGRVRSIRRAYLLGAPRTPPREHKVRGNFHHHGGLTQGCGHQWPMQPDEHGVWECSRCQRRRWWVSAHKRGDAARGVVVHDYEVKTPEPVV